MGKKRNLLFAGAIILSFLFLPKIFAQAPVSEVDYSYGKIVSISQDKLEISEYDYDKNAEVNTVYSLGPNVEIRNAKSLKDISIGDNIEIDYIIKDNDKIIKVITLETDNDSDFDNS